MSRREIPVNFQQTISSEEGTYSISTEPPSCTRPFTPMEALMCAAPGQSIETSQMEMLALRDVLSDAIERLSPRHRWVLEQNLIHRVPVRTLGAMMDLGKSYVWKLKEEALAALRADLEDHPTIQAYLDRHSEEDE